MIIDPLPAESSAITAMMWGFSLQCNHYKEVLDQSEPESMCRHPDCRQRDNPHYGCGPQSVCGNCHRPQFEHIGRPVGISVEKQLQRILDALRTAGYPLVKRDLGRQVYDDEFKAQATFPRELLRTVVWRAYQGVCDRSWVIGALSADYCPDCGNIWVWHTLPAVSEEEKLRLVRASFALLEAGYRFGHSITAS